MANHQYHRNEVFNHKLPPSILEYQQSQYTAPLQNPGTNWPQSYQSQPSSSNAMPQPAPNAFHFDFDASELILPPSFDTLANDAQFTFSLQHNEVPTPEWHSQQSTSVTNSNGGDASYGGHQPAQLSFDLLDMSGIHDSPVPRQADQYDVVDNFNDYLPNFDVDGAQASGNGGDASFSEAPSTWLPIGLSNAPNFGTPSMPPNTTQPDFAGDLGEYEEAFNFSDALGNSVANDAHLAPNVGHEGLDAVIAELVFAGYGPASGQGTAGSDQQSISTVDATFDVDASTFAPSMTPGYPAGPLGNTQDNWQIPQPAAVREVAGKASSRQLPTGVTISTVPTSKFSTGTSVEPVTAVCVPQQSPTTATQRAPTLGNPIMSTPELNGLTMLPATHGTPVCPTQAGEQATTVDYFVTTEIPRTLRNHYAREDERQRSRQAALQPQSTSNSASSAPATNAQASATAHTVTQPMPKRKRGSSEDDVGSKRHRGEQHATPSSASNQNPVPASLGQNPIFQYSEYHHAGALTALYLMGRFSPSMSRLVAFRIHSGDHLYAHSYITCEKIQVFWTDFQRRCPIVAGFIFVMVDFFNWKYQEKTITLFTQVDLWLRHGGDLAGFIPPQLKESEGVPNNRTQSAQTYQPVAGLFTWSTLTYLGLPQTGRY